MFEYFPEYSWNLALSMALDMGANLDEIDRACRSLRDEPMPADKDPAEAFFDAWAGAARKLEESAADDEQAQRHLSAAEKYRRAAVMYITAERMPLHTLAARHVVYDRLLASFGKYVEFGQENCEKVRVPYKGSYLPALFVRAKGSAPAPCVVHFNGLDGIKEFLYLTGFAQALGERRVSALLVDNPGVGEALRKLDLHNAPDAEVPAAACLDYLTTRGDVDATRVGMVALSMGGYHAPRATAFEPRFKCCVAWGANYDFGKRFRSRVAGKGTQKSVPHVLEHVKWVLGVDSIEECQRIADGFTLDGILDRIRVPILVTHGEGDRQIPLADAHKTYEGCVNSPRRDLRIFTAAEGGEQHCSIGNMSLATNYMADWISEVLGT
jgi:dienelactone hydrolase